MSIEQPGKPAPPAGKAAPAKRFKVMSDLLRDTSPRAEGVEDLLNAKQIRRDRIVRDPDQPRRTFNREGLEELADSIRSHGILQPITVRYDRPNDRYIVVTGERRWRASEIAGLTTLPALVVGEQSDDDRLIVQLMENMQREDLNAVDRAEGLQRLKEAMGGVSWEQVADKVGIKRSRLFQLLNLLDTTQVTEAERTAIRKGDLTEKHIRSVSRHLSGPKREGLLHVMIEDKMSVQEATFAKDALLRNPHITDQTPVAQVIEAVRQVRRETKTPRPPEPRINLIASLPGGNTLPAIDDNALADVREYADQLQRYLLAMSAVNLTPAQVRRIRPMIRRLRDAADLFLDANAKE